jgi:hypothetical protein
MVLDMKGPEAASPFFIRNIFARHKFAYFPLAIRGKNSKLDISIIF